MHVSVMSRKRYPSESAGFALYGKWTAESPDSSEAD